MWFNQKSCPRGAHLESNLNADPIDLSARIAQMLGQHVRNVPTSRRVIDGNKHGWSLGPKAPTVISTNGPEFAPSGSTQHTGLAGEFAVISELLFCRWNATKLPVDDGVDVVATQGHELRTVQVKTGYSNLHHYYAFVMRRMLPLRWFNDLLLMTSGDIESLDSRGALGGGPSGKWTLCIEVANGRYFTRSGIDLTEKVNSFKTQFK